METLVRPIFCENPYVIVNPMAITIAPYAVSWYCGGNNIKPHCWSNNNYIPWRMLNQIRHHLRSVLNSNRNYTIFDDYYIVSAYGEVIPLFLPVPCSKCECCQHTKATTLSQQVAFEMQLHEDRPLWCTLTYNDKNLPSDKMLHYVDFQKFMKRLRITIQRNYGIKFPIKYVVVGEYGAKYNRPHFHCILFGIDKVKLNVNFQTIQRLVSFAWLNTEDRQQYSFSQYCKDCDDSGITPANDYNRHPYSRGHVDVVPLEDSKASLYLSKYISKQGLRIRKSVNLGVPFARLYEPQLRSGSPFIDWFDKHNSEMHHEEVLVSYFINKLFPKESSLIEPQLKRYGLEILNTLNDINIWFAHHDIEPHIDIDSIEKQILEEFPFLSFVKFPHSLGIRDSISLDVELLQRLISNMNQCYIEHPFDWKIVEENRNIREKIFSVLQDKYRHSSVADRIYKLKNKVKKEPLHSDNQ